MRIAQVRLSAEEMTGLLTMMERIADTQAGDCMDVAERVAERAPGIAKRHDNLADVWLRLANASRDVLRTYAKKVGG